MALNNKNQRSNWSNEGSISENRCNISSCQLIITSVRYIILIPVEILGVTTRKKQKKFCKNIFRYRGSERWGSFIFRVKIIKKSFKLLKCSLSVDIKILDYKIRPLPLKSLNSMEIEFKHQNFLKKARLTLKSCFNAFLTSTWVVYINNTYYI